jgi:hypothetical protein
MWRLFMANTQGLISSHPKLFMSFVAGGIICYAIGRYGYRAARRFMNSSPASRLLRDVRRVPKLLRKTKEDAKKVIAEAKNFSISTKRRHKRHHASKVLHAARHKRRTPHAAHS